MARDHVEVIGGAVVDFTIGVVRGGFRTGMFLFRVGSLAATRGRVRRKALADERASREQQRAWFKAIARQKARGDADFASETEAQAALRGKGGRPSKLDDRWF